MLTTNDILLLYIYAHTTAPPKWIVEPEDTAVLDTQLTIINCQAEGYPEPRVTWTRVSGSVFKLFCHSYTQLFLISL